MAKVNDIVRQYFTSPKYQELAVNSKASYESCLRNLSLCKINNIPFLDLYATDVTPAVVELLRDEILSTRGPSALKLTFALMNNVWSKAWRMEQVKLNPWTRPGIKKKQRKTMWDDQQITRFVFLSRNYLRLDDLALVFLLIYETGMRPIDVLCLKKCEIVNNRIEREQIKTNTHVSLLIPEYLLAALQPQFDMDSDWLFPHGKSGFAHRPYDWLNKNAALVKNLDPVFKGLQLRDLRRTAITEAHNAGATDWQVQNFGGHKNPSSTLPYRVMNNHAAHEAQRRRWQARQGTDQWDKDTKPSNEAV